jgi:hypothetical protein
MNWYLHYMPDSKFYKEWPDDDQLTETCREDKNKMKSTAVC